MSASQRNKGARFERRIADELRVAGYTARRNLAQYQETDGADLEVNACLTFQLKCGKSPRWKDALREAVTAARKRNHYAVAVTKADREEPVVHMPWHDFLELASLPDIRRTLTKSETGREWFTLLDPLGEKHEGGAG